jgi:hypothetical protein
MPTSFKDTLDIILALAALIGIVLHVAKTKSDIEKLIDNVKDDLTDRLRDLGTDIKVSQARQDGRREMTEYYINDLYYQVNHRFYRCWEQIKDLQSFLKKDGFVVRVRDEEPPAPKKIKVEEI